MVQPKSTAANWRHSGLQDLNPVFRRSQSTRVFFFSDKILSKKRERILKKINSVVVVVVVVFKYIYIYIYVLIKFY